MLTCEQNCQKSKHFQRHWSYRICREGSTCQWFCQWFYRTSSTRKVELSLQVISSWYHLIPSGKTRGLNWNWNWRLFVIFMVTCNDNNIRWDVKDSHCVVQRNRHLNSKTGDPIETSAKGEISRPEAYENHTDTDGSGRQLGQHWRDTIKCWWRSVI